MSGEVTADLPRPSFRCRGVVFKKTGDWMRVVGVDSPDAAARRYADNVLGLDWAGPITVEVEGHGLIELTQERVVRCRWVVQVGRAQP